MTILLGVGIFMLGACVGAIAASAVSYQEE